MVTETPREDYRENPRVIGSLVGAERTNVGDAHGNSAEVRDRILRTASTLFYQRGVRAVGVDLVVEEAGVAKTSLYRYFRTKDDLIAAFLQREDEDFGNCVTELQKTDPVA